MSAIHCTSQLRRFGAGFSLRVTSQAIRGNSLAMKQGFSEFISFSITPF
jgi:hypothetical protein